MGVMGRVVMLEITALGVLPSDKWPGFPAVGFLKPKPSLGIRLPVFSMAKGRNLQ